MYLQRRLTRAITSSPKSSANAPPARSSSRGRPRLDDPSVDEDDRAVCDLDGGEALRRDEHCAARERRPEARDEAPLGERVHGRERVVEHDHPRAA